MAATAQDLKKKSEEGIWETFKVIVQALLIAFVVRTFLYQPFNIPSGSMYPTLKVGDYLFVSKLSYGYSKYSFNTTFGAFASEFFKVGPFSFAGRHVLADTPKRGQVAVFKTPKDNETDFIKRVIGLPGDRIQMTSGVLSINGKEIPKKRIEDFVDPAGEGKGAPQPQYIETLPEGISYRVLDIDDTSRGDNTAEFTVPAGHYFMMGDNRDNSSDSRWSVPEGVGFVPVENFVGRADIIFFSIEPEASLRNILKWPFLIRWGRFFNLLG